MKIRYLSDLHIDPTWFLPFDPPVHKDDHEQVLVLAGDVAEYKHVAEFVFQMSKRFKHVVYVFGNHEYYNTSISRGLDKVKGKITQLNDNKYPTNIHILEDDYVIIDDVAFIGATLWSSMDERHPFTMWTAKDRMNDFKRIRQPSGDGRGQNAYGRRLTPTTTVTKHYHSRQYIMDAAKTIGNDLDQTVRKIVVVTHHGPTKQSIDPSYIGNGLNGAYVSELTEEIQLAPIDLWFHGHVHCNMDYIVTYEDDPRPTRVLTNPRGYRMKKHPNQVENHNFVEDAVVEI
ncbi:MAG: metallophosphoesterase [Neptunomonas phycophila]|uniref:metallophosphoesterase n=1 Tax=Neptunomonas phycophila TaxID=1572645 RepID=UPI003B8DAC03